MSTTSDSSTSPAAPFQPGAVVYLNSGSPPLTVQQAFIGDAVGVVWVVDGQEHTASLPPACLTTKRPVFNDDLERKQFYMQLATGVELPRSKALPAYVITNPAEMTLTRMKEDAQIQKKVAQLRAEKEAAVAGPADEPVTRFEVRTVCRYNPNAPALVAKPGQFADLQPRFVVREMYEDFERVFGYSPNYLVLAIPSMGVSEEEASALFTFAATLHLVSVPGLSRIQVFTGLEYQSELVMTMDPKPVTVVEEQTGETVTPRVTGMTPAFGAPYGFVPPAPKKTGPGLFIVLEGIDGSGKTTQLQMLREHFEKQGRKVVCLREPGGTPLGEELRRLLKDPLLAICNTAELLMFLAARAQLLEQKVRLALECNSVVLMDRFTPSTIAYQGYGREMGSQSVRRLAAFVETITPRHTFWIDLPLTTARERLHGAAADKFDQLDDAFFTRTLEGYLSCIHTYPGFQHVDGRGTPEGVQQEILNHLAAAQLPA